MGVGGKRPAAELDAVQPLCKGGTHGATVHVFAHVRLAGFAVVKKGKDKKTGEPVAIKVRLWQRLSWDRTHARCYQATTGLTLGLG